MISGYKWLFLGIDEVQNKGASSIPFLLITNTMEFNIKKLRYDIDQILGHFGLERSKNCPLIQDWLSTPLDPNFVLPELLEKKREKLDLEGDVWNEEELKMHFLSIVFSYADVEIPKKIKLFYERTLSATVQDTSLSVICDAMLASPYGINTPDVPYFFLQEFKKGKKATDDAEGQMLVAMLIAQAKNVDNHPIFGSYVLGRDWFFTTLQGKNYCFSDPLDAAKREDLSKILMALKKLKDLIKKRID